MKNNFLLTTLLSMSILSLNLLSASCNGKSCMVDLSTLKVHKVQEKKNLPVKHFHTEKYAEDKYDIVMIDNIETIVFPKEVPLISEGEQIEYELSQIANTAELLVENDNNLPNSDYYCEENLKVVILENSEHTYICA